MLTPDQRGRFIAALKFIDENDSTPIEALFLGIFVADGIMGSPDYMEAVAEIVATVKALEN